MLTNRANGKQYVGITTRTLEERWYHHVYAATHENMASCPLLARAIRKHGAYAFDKEIIATAENSEDLRRKECLWIENLGTTAPAGYNLTGGADGQVDIHPETIAKMSEAQRARFADGPQTNPMYGHRLTRASTARRFEIYVGGASSDPCRSGRSCHETHASARRIQSRR